MDVQKYCIFACGGRGTRMGADIPKQFLRIGEKTILQLCIEKILAAEPDVHVVVVLPQEYIQFWKDECAQRNFTIRQSVVRGGLSRFHSVRNALEKISDPQALVAVHDGVRPLCSETLVRALFDAAAQRGNAVPVTPVTDTLKVLTVLEDGSYKTVEGVSADRSVLFGAQTPQVFTAQTIKAAYELPYNTAFTDDASVVQASGHEIFYLTGERYNIKITTPEDLLLARRLLL